MNFWLIIAYREHFNPDPICYNTSKWVNRGENYEETYAGNNRQSKKEFIQSFLAALSMVGTVYVFSVGFLLLF
jgi:hypothetical protein